MKHNIGNTDRIIRFVIGFALIGWALFGGPTWAWIGVVPLATAVIRFCPAYVPFGFRTCPPEGDTPKPAA